MLHDWIQIEPEISKGVLKIQDDNINTGIVKLVGLGYYSDYGSFIDNINVTEGDRIVFTQHVQWDIDGKKNYFVRGRDVVKVLNVQA